MKYNFITIGGATRDISFFTDQGVIINNKKDLLRQKLLAFEYGAKIKVDKFYYSYGGGAANAAVSLANFGSKTACIASLGDDENGRYILKNLKNHGVETRGVKLLKNEDSGSSFILVAPDGERIIFGARGANFNLKLTGNDLKVLAQTSNIYLSSLSGDWNNVLKDIFSLVEKNKINIYWNPGGKQILAGLKKLLPFLKNTTVLALNKDEAIELVLSSNNHNKLSAAYLNKPENLLEIIKSFGPKIVVITMGGDGVVVSDGNKIYRHQVIKEKNRVDTTGIGDAFNSSFAAGFSYYNDIDKALHLALKNTASKISHLGAQNGLIKKNLFKK
ncbi:MAG: carbohydrate kinase family protein [Patescibacteria group bacterium]